MAGNKNSGGKPLVSRNLIADVRKLTLQEIKKALTGKDLDFKKQVILRLAGSVLPRQLEHTGEDGGPVNINIIKYADHNTSV